MAEITLVRICPLAPYAAVYSCCLSRQRLPQVHFGATRFEGTGNLDVRLRQRGKRWVWVGEDAIDEAAEVAESGRRAIQDKKAKQDAFERDVAFEYFSRMPSGELASQHAASSQLDRIARTLVDAPRGRRSFNQTRRRVGELRKEFLRLCS